MEILIATGNTHKAQEIQKILDGLRATWRTAAEWPDLPEVQENGSTYEENATLKATEWARRTGLWTLADDSGLEVDALDGRPGVLSSRYGANSEERNARLLEELHHTPEEKRTARFVCAVVLSDPAGQRTFTEKGTLEGRIAKGSMGQHGFGYDPVFIPNGFEGTHLAELSPAAKNEISHRSRAVRAIRPTLERLIEGKL